MRTLSESGRTDFASIDQKIFLSKEFVAVWRGATSPEKLQFLRFLKGDDVCPEKLLGVYQRLVFLRGADGGSCYDFVSTTLLLGSHSHEFRELRRDCEPYFQAISLRAS